MVNAVLIGLFLLVIASTWWGGLWGNFITLINLFIASLIASSFYEPLARFLIEKAPDYGALMDFIAVWGLLVLSFIGCRILTEILASHKMKFDFWTEMIGRSVLSIWIACVFVAFTTFTFHMAPFHPDDFQSDVETATLGIGPDRMWLAFIQSRSRGALSAAPPTVDSPRIYSPMKNPDDAELNARVFDPSATFIDYYQERRVDLSQRNNFKDNWMLGSTSF